MTQSTGTTGRPVRSASFTGSLTRYRILKPARGWPQASDHVPVMVELAL